MAFDVLPTEELADRFSGTGDAQNPVTIEDQPWLFDLSLSLGELVGGPPKLEMSRNTHHRGLGGGISDSYGRVCKRRRFNDRELNIFLG